MASSPLVTGHHRPPTQRRRRESPEADYGLAKIRVENIHYDLTEDDLDVLAPWQICFPRNSTYNGLQELFRRIGPITKLQLRYDRAGRSEGTAFVTYEVKEDALEAIRQFDGANANGMPGTPSP